MKRPAALVVMLACLGCAAGSARAEPCTISAAISLEESLGQVGHDYHDKTGDDVRFNFDASGRLEQQIKAGAPVDGFVSAGDREVDDLAKAGLADAATRHVVVTNALVLIVPGDATAGPRSFADLATDPGKLAVGDPQTVPAGHYAQQTLAALKLTGAVAPRLLTCQNVRQVLTYVRRGEASAGLVYATDARQAGGAVRVVATADPATHDPIEYPAVVVTGAAHAAAAGRFLAYLSTPAARAVLIAHGFAVPRSGERPTSNAQR